MNMKIDNTYEEQDDQLFPRKVAIRLASNKNRNRKTEIIVFNRIWQTKHQT